MLAPVESVGYREDVDTTAGRAAGEVPHQRAGTSVRVVRPLTADEREVLRAVVVAGAPEGDELRAALLAQVDAAQVTGPSCPCGCASIGLVVARAEAPPAAVAELSADAVDGDDAVGFRVLLSEGYLDDVEFYGYGDTDSTTWPRPDLIR